MENHLKSVRLLTCRIRPFQACLEISDNENIPCIGLPDPEHRVAVKYRQQVNLFKLGRMPLVCIIDKDGRIRYAHYSASMADIPENKILLDVIDQLIASSN